MKVGRLLVNSELFQSIKRWDPELTELTGLGFRHELCSVVFGGVAHEEAMGSVQFTFPPAAQVLQTKQTSIPTLPFVGLLHFVVRSVTAKFVITPLKFPPIGGSTS
jgi:hypothetical protein